MRYASFANFYFIWKKLTVRNFLIVWIILLTIAIGSQERHSDNKIQLISFQCSIWFFKWFISHIVIPPIGKKTTTKIEFSFQIHVIVSTNRSLIRRNTRRRIINSINMKTPCNVLHTSVIRKNRLFGDIRNDNSSIIQVTPSTTHSRKNNLNLEINYIISIGLRKKYTKFTFEEKENVK